jgi:hypothetical protein
LTLLNSGAEGDRPIEVCVRLEYTQWGSAEAGSGISRAGGRSSEIRRATAGCDRPRRAAELRV